MAGLVVDDSSPAKARKMGTPALLRVYIWRENTRMSSITTGLRLMRTSHWSTGFGLLMTASAMWMGAIPWTLS
ncbi:hypothetical protein GALL_538350 [mine drainage metagenome]|uniref:Uncharacterized protein n=1 Tax=mine drainage metagenome TaxID=410659 RepID=A0A1J5P0K1_9ZZZZ